MRILLIVIALGTLTKAYPQFSEQNSLYGEAGFFWGNHSGFELGINYIRNEKYSFQVSYYYHYIEAKEKPADFHNSSIFDWGPSFFPDVDVPDINHSFNILAGYIYNLNQKGTIRLNLQAGIALLHTRYVTNFEKKASPAMFGSNYFYDTKYRNTAAIIINPRIDFPFFKGYGLSVSPVVEFGGRKTVYGIGLTHIFGLVRKPFEDPKQELEQTTD